MAHGNDTECDRCKEQYNHLISYRKWSHIRPCFIKDEKGSRESLEAVFENELYVCYPCYKILIRQEINN